MLTEKESKILKEEKTVGDCCCRFFDKDGSLVTGELHDRPIGLTLQQLKKVPTSIGRVAGEDKAHAIYSQLKNNNINSLMTDENILRKGLKCNEIQT